MPFSSIGIPQEIAVAIRSDERLLWWSKPRSGVFLQAFDILFIPLSLLWGGFAVYWEWKVVTTNAPMLFRLWGIPFLVAALYLVVGRFFHDAHRRERTVYAVTDHRVIILGGTFSSTIRSVEIRLLADITLQPNRGTEGTIVLGPVGAGGEGDPRPVSPALVRIPDAARVFDLICEIQAS